MRSTYRIERFDLDFVDYSESAARLRLELPARCVFDHAGQVDTVFHMDRAENGVTVFRNHTDRLHDKPIAYIELVTLGRNGEHP